jgi:hypothetical protein
MPMAMSRPSNGPAPVTSAMPAAKRDRLKRQQDTRDGKHRSGGKVNPIALGFRRSCCFRLDFGDSAMRHLSGQARRWAGSACLPIAYPMRGAPV